MPNISIMILDDQKARHDGFRRNFIGCHKIHTWTAKEAIDTLSNNKFDIIFLDHDLGGEVYVESGPGTGYEVAEWISKHPEIKDSIVVIHSFNPTGCRNMYNILERAGFKVVIDKFPCNNVKLTLR